MKDLIVMLFVVAMCFAGPFMSWLLEVRRQRRQAGVVVRQAKESTITLDCPDYGKARSSVSIHGRQ